MGFNLIKNIKTEVDDFNRLFENCNLVTEDVDILCEEADRWLQNVILTLKSGKNPFETIPGSRELTAGLMLLGDEDNRDALNIGEKKFDLISKFIDKKDSVRKYVAGIATEHGQSIIDNLDAHVADGEKRKILAKKLTKLQQSFSTIKHKVGVQGKKPHGVAKLA